MTSDKPAFSIDMNYLRKILDEMIEINSILGNEKALALYLAEECQKLGLAIQLEDVEPNRPNIYAHHSFTKKGKTLNFNAHIDTVDVSSDWDTDPFVPVEKDNKLFGLGSVDMKAGIACELAAIKALLDSNLELSGQIHFSGVIDEEGYGKGAKSMLRNSFFGKPDAIIIPEPFFGDSKTNALPLGMSGKILYKISFAGKAAHAFHPDDGINAIDDAATFIAKLMASVTDEKFEPTFPLHHDSNFGYGSFCVLKIDGGYKIYSVTVPEYCEIILNRLLVTGETKESATEDLIEFIKKLNLNSNVSVDVVQPFYKSYKLDKDQPIMKALIQSYSEILETEPQFTYWKTITDANIFTGEANIPALVFGPKGGNLHTDNEFVEIDSLEKVAKTYFQIYYNYQKES